ncbi:MAG: hypothetical protein DMF09_11355 [Verrucomicrobia bacterium]|nr:MAG: hypothetical protein DMF09_11355 [Verrucomicrobiota bacterium]
MTKRVLMLAISLCLATLMAKFFFRHSTFPRYIQAVWNHDSTKCLLLDAPDNASTFVWGFRIQNGGGGYKKLDYEAISTEIERVRPEARHSDPHTVRCREDHLELRFGSAPTYNLHQHLYRCVY